MADFSEYPNGTTNPTDYDEFSDPFDMLFHELEKIIVGFVMSGVAILGIVGNLCLLIMLFHHKSFWRQLKPYVTALALNDVLLLTTAWFLFSHTNLTYHRFLPEARNWLVHTYPGTYGLANFTFIYHIWITIAITFERYAALCHPLWHVTLQPQRTACLSLFLVTLLSILYSLPRFFELAVVKIHRPDPANQNLTISNEVIMRTEHSETVAYHVTYKITGQLLFMTLGPLIIMTAFTVRIAYAVKKSQSLRRKQLRQDASTRPVKRSIRYGKKRIKNGSFRTLNPSLLNNAQSPMPALAPWINYNVTEFKTVSEILLQERTIDRLNVPRRSSAMSRREGLTWKLSNEKHSESPKIQTSKLSRGNRPLWIILGAAMFAYTLPTLVDLIELTMMTKRRELVMNYMTMFSNLAVMLDAACTFYVYLLFSRRFRKFATCSTKTNKNVHSDYGIKPRSLDVSGESTRRLSIKHSGD